MPKASMKEQRAPAVSMESPSNSTPDELCSVGAPDSFGFLYEAACVLQSSLDVEAIAVSLSRLAVPRLGDVCIVDLVEGDEIRRVAVAHADPARQGLASGLLSFLPQPHDDAHPIVHAIRAGRGLPVVWTEPTDEMLRTLAPEPEQRVLLHELGTRAVLVMPLASDDRPVGAFTLLVCTPRRSFGAPDVEDVKRLASRAECAFRNARLFDEVRAALRLREDVLSVVSHDLRNPLSRVYLATDQLQRVVPAEHARHVEIIRRSAQHMNRLIQDLVEITKLEQGRLALDRRRHQVDVLVRDAIDMVAQQIEQKSVELGEAIERGLPAITVDRMRIVQVLTNLLDNAIKHTGAGGKITIAARSRDGSISITVRDTGPGIPPELLPHVFDRFRQAKRWSRDGAGLGLAIARGIVEAHGGKISASSDPGAGSTFEVLLPAG